MMETPAPCPPISSKRIALCLQQCLGQPPALSACAQLAPGEFEAERTGFFPSLQQTLNHILIIDWFYVDALEGGMLGPKAWENRVPHPRRADLEAAQRAVDQRLIDHCNALTPESLGMIVTVNRVTRMQHERRDRLLMHLFQHQIHHRGRPTP